MEIKRLRVYTDSTLKKTRRDGQTLIEVIVAGLLLGMMTIPIMAAALGGRQLTAKTSRRLQAAADLRHAAEALKAYVVADTTLVSGPGTGGGGWVLPGDTSGLKALAAGHHVLLPATWLPDLAVPPYNGTISYDVAVRSTPQGPQPDVVFNVQWADQ
jgi:type II secretory pathway pseudopilin PulG